MQKTNVVENFLFPADQQPPRPIEPRMRAFNFPATRFAMAMLWLGRNIAFGRHVRLVTTPSQQPFNRSANIAFIQTKMLRFTPRRCWPWHRNIVQRVLHEFLVVHIGPVHRSPQRNSATVDQHRTLDADFPAIGRVFPGFFPHPAATCSSPRPNSAIPSRCPSSHRILPMLPATACGTRPVVPTLESRREWRCRSRIHAALPSTGSRCGARKRFQSRPFAVAIVDAHLYNFVGNLVTTVRSGSTEHRVSGETLTHNSGTSAHLHAVTKTIRPPPMHVVCQ